MLINPPQGYKTITTQPTPQVTPQVNLQHITNKIITASENIIKLAIVLSDQKLTTAQIMTAMKLKDRKSFKSTYIDEAIDKKFVKMLYPDRPNHPRQKYYLTVKGLALLNNDKS